MIYKLHHSKTRLFIIINYFAHNEFQNQQMQPWRKGHVHKLHAQQEQSPKSLESTSSPPAIL